MESIRQQQVAKLIQQSISDIFIKHGRDIYGRAFITLTKVYITPDLLLARVYLSVYNVTDKQQVIDTMSENVYFIKGKMGNQIRNKVRRIPELEFYLDETLEEVNRVEQLFEKLDKNDNDTIK